MSHEFQLYCVRSAVLDHRHAILKARGVTMPMDKYQLVLDPVGKFAVLILVRPTVVIPHVSGV
jgi:hypothetical protein